MSCSAEGFRFREAAWRVSAIPRRGSVMVSLFLSLCVFVDVEEEGSYVPV